MDNNNIKNDNGAMLEVLLSEMDDLENEFVKSPAMSGLPSLPKIYQSQKFKLWRSRVINELDGNTDKLAQNILNEMGNFKGWNDKSLFDNIRAELTVIIENQNKKGNTVMNTNDTIVTSNEKSNKLFISHAKADKEYVEVLTELLASIGMEKDSIVCSSVAGYGLPNGAVIFDWLREQFINYNLRVLFVLSWNYYKSVACLNEMGAAWITKATDTLLLLPEIGFKDIQGCVDSRKIGISFDEDEYVLKDRLNPMSIT